MYNVFLIRTDFVIKKSNLSESFNATPHLYSCSVYRFVKTLYSAVVHFRLEYSGAKM